MDLWLFSAFHTCQLFNVRCQLWNSDKWKHICDAHPCAVSQDESPQSDRHKMFAFFSMLFLQSISCWQVRRKMSNKCRENIWVSSTLYTLSINSYIPSLQSQLEIALFSHSKLCCLSTAWNQPNTLSGICWGFPRPWSKHGIREEANVKCR